MCSQKSITDCCLYYQVHSKWSVFRYIGGKFNEIGGHYSVRVVWGLIDARTTLISVPGEAKLSHHTSTPDTLFHTPYSPDFAKGRGLIPIPLYRFLEQNSIVLTIKLKSLITSTHSTTIKNITS